MEGCFSLYTNLTNKITVLKHLNGVGKFIQILPLKQSQY